MGVEDGLRRPVLSLSRAYRVKYGDQSFIRIVLNGYLDYVLFSARYACYCEKSEPTRAQRVGSTILSRIITRLDRSWTAISKTLM